MVGGGRVKIGKILLTSFMDGPLQQEIERKYKQKINWIWYVWIVRATLGTCDKQKNTIYGNCFTDHIMVVW